MTSLQQQLEAVQPILDQIKGLTAKPMNAAQYQYELEIHDWDYEMSDDPKYYRAGEYNEHKLKRLCQGNEEFTKLFNSMYEAKKNARRPSRPVVKSHPLSGMMEPPEDMEEPCKH